MRVWEVKGLKGVCGNANDKSFGRWRRREKGGGDINVGPHHYYSPAPTLSTTTANCHICTLNLPQIPLVYLILRNPSSESQIILEKVRSIGETWAGSDFKRNWRKKKELKIEELGIGWLLGNIMYLHFFFLKMSFWDLILNFSLYLRTKVTKLETFRINLLKEILPFLNLNSFTIFFFFYFF